MRKYISFLVILGMFVQISSPVLAEAALMIPKGFTFQKDLKMGQTVDPDVRHLQNLLNSNPATRVAASGTGSDASLTAYFGSKTRDAVMRFQALYASEVLAPAGLTAPTGFVGSLTRAKLNSLFYALSESKNRTPPTPFAATPNAAAATSSAILVNSAVTVSDLSTYRAVPGQTVTVFGQGFDAQSNTVQIGETVIDKVPATSDGTKMTFVIPSNAQNGVFSIVVYSRKGVANSGPIALQISSPTAAAAIRPVITAVSPKTTSNPLQIVTLTGSGFSNSNDIVTNLGTIRSLRSLSGDSLTFYLATLPFYYQAEQKYKGQSINLIINVSNEYGTTSQPATVTINVPSNPGTPTSAQGLQSALDSLALLQSQLASSTATTTATSTESISEQVVQQNAPQQQSGGAQSAVTTTAVGGSTYSETGSSQQNSSGGDGSSGLVAAGIIGGVALAAVIAQAVAAAKTIPPYFGGRILTVTPCEQGWLLFTVEDFAHLHAVIPLTFDPKMSRLNAYFKITPGVWTIGGYLPIPKPCSVSGVVIGTSIGTVDLIRGIGTSVLPGIPGL